MRAPAQSQSLIESVADDLGPCAEELAALTATCLPLPEDLAIEDALLIPLTAKALRVWRRLQLEMGEAAVYTDGGILAEFVGVIAQWHGAMPVIRLTATSTDGDATVRIDDPSGAVARVRSLIGSAPAAAAVDLSGQGKIIEILLESLPRWGRLMLAGACWEPFTTEFYTDIHRKGVTVCSGSELNSLRTNPSLWTAEARSACRLLLNEKRAATLRGCVGRARA